MNGKVTITKMDKSQFGIIIGCIILLLFVMTACIGQSDRNNDHEVEGETVSSITGEDSLIEGEAVSTVDAEDKENTSLPSSTYIIEPFISEVERIIGVPVITGKIPTSRAVVYEGVTSSQAEVDMMETLSEYNAVEMDLGTLLTLPGNILFDYDDDELRHESEAVVDQIVQIIEATEGTVYIAGHTDNHGTPEYNQDLSERRAYSVLETLVERGIDEGRLIAEGFGESKPIARNNHADGTDNPDGRQKNRRVEITIEGLQ
ncbi:MULTISPECIES: OmpA family protein [Bacillaceae]|uniref:OmpA family protein n=1 Tax=Evansella alkalicola TaxID=745819 RepID=A0ABS6JXP4_9BACI|nr:OmpA family protein [Litchfieldia alkalitelluris]MBU9723369.1 OmpA family protein [Bacillus alkalicola]